MGLKSKSKGRRAEQELVRLARSRGLPARRTWETSQSPDLARRASDVEVASEPYQVKRLRKGFQGLYDGLEHVAGLFLRADGRGWLAVLRAEDFLKLLRARTAKAAGGKKRPALHERSWIKRRRVTGVLKATKATRSNRLDVA